MSYKDGVDLTFIDISLVCGWFFTAFPQPRAGYKANSHAPSFPRKGGDNTILICDTRQQAGKHRNIENYCRKHGIETVNKKCDVGDYMFPDGKISVDTKQNL